MLHHGANPVAPLYRQIYERVRMQILDGRLRPGERVPATRTLADELGVARNTVARAYDDLLAEGYLRGRRGSGTYVAEIRRPGEDAIDERSTPRLTSWARRALVSLPVSIGAYPPPGRKPAPIETTSSRLPQGEDQACSERSRGAEDVTPLAYDFRPGTPDWDAFPRIVWWRLLGRRLREGAQLGRYGDPAGYPPLRAAIARHVAAARAVVCRPEQVVIVNGTQQAIDLLGKLLIEPGDEVVVENPGYADARLALAAYGARLRPIAVDDDGLRTDDLPRVGSARFVYVTPSHQFPTGATLPLERRLRLLDWARRAGALVLEDDAYAELRYAGRPVESLQGLDRGRDVVYLGTFSTVLFPPLRIGYAVLPPPLVEPFVRAKWLADRGTDLLEQQALADFLAEGYFARHLQRMRRLGRERRDALLHALQHWLAGAVEVHATDTGMYLMARLPGVDEDALVAAAAERGVGVHGAAPAYLDRRPAGATLVLGFGGLPVPAIQEGVRLLGDAYGAVSAKRR